MQEYWLIIFAPAEAQAVKHGELIRSGPEKTHGAKSSDKSYE